MTNLHILKLVIDWFSIMMKIVPEILPEFINLECTPKK